MSDKLDYLLAALDCYLKDGYNPAEAWQKALEGYAYVYHTDDGRTPLARAATVALRDFGIMSGEANE